MQTDRDDIDDTEDRAKYNDSAKMLMQLAGAAVQETLRFAFGEKAREIHIAVAVKLPNDSVLITCSPEWGNTLTSDLLAAEQRLGQLTGDKINFPGDPLPPVN